MVSNETEYQEAVARLSEEKKRLEAQEIELEKMSLSTEGVKRVLDPARSVRLQLKEEVQSYEKQCSRAGRGMMVSGPTA